MLRRAVATAVLAAFVAACSGAASPAPAVTSVPSVAASVAASTAPSEAASPAASASSAPAGSAAAGGTAVTIQGFAFDPKTLTVKVGTTVTWTNQDSVGHTVTLDDGSAGSGTLQQGATFQQTFSKAGSFAYHCKIHPSMTATVTVTG
jgi:plastocyanin